ncbi:MAG: FtsQ-type POTRA domain-containing protein [Gemmatimonadota bacterium]
MSDKSDLPTRASRKPRNDGDAPDPSDRPRRHWRRLAKPAAIAAAVFVVLLSPLWAPKILRHMDFFHVRHIEVVGARYLDPAEILARLRVDTTVSVWDPTEAARDRVAAHPLVRDVSIGRKLPGTLVVRIVEHAPVALVPGDNGFSAYDERAVVLPIDPTVADVDVPILFARDSALLKLLGAVRTGAPALYSRLSEIQKGGPGEITFVLDSLPVRTMSDVTLQRLTDLEFVERDLARRRLRATELDLRYRDQVIARFQ